jgi:hypothetical protein
MRVREAWASRTRRHRYRAADAALSGRYAVRKEVKVDVKSNAMTALTCEGSGAGWPLGKLTDYELSRRLGELKEALSEAAEVPGGSDEWREIELQIADVMNEQADRVRIRRSPAGRVEAVPEEGL